MSELIDRAALLESLPKGDLEHDEKISKCGAIADAVMLICDAPSVDAVEVVRKDDDKHADRRDICWLVARVCKGNCKQTDECKDLSYWEWRGVKEEQ